MRKCPPETSTPSTPHLLLASLFFALAPAVTALSTGWTWANPVPSGASLTTVTQSQAGTIFASGADSTFLRRTSSAWQPLFAEIPIHVAASVTASDGTLFAAGEQVGGETARLLRWDGRSWAAVGEATFLVQSLCALSARDAWMGGFDPATGDTVAVHWDGTRSSASVLAPGTNEAVDHLWASSPADVWALAIEREQKSQTLYHFDGTSWTAETLPDEISGDPVATGLVGSGASRPILVVSSKTAGGLRVWEKTPTGWSVNKEAEGYVPTAAAVAPDGTLAVSCYRGGTFAPTVLIRKGGNWAEEETDTSEIFVRLAGTPAGGFLAIGEYDSVFSRAASGWTNLTPRRHDNFSDFSRLADGTLLLCGYDSVSNEGTVIRREVDGRFTTLLAVPGGKFQKIQTGPDGVLWVVGFDLEAVKGFVYRSADGNVFTKDFESTSQDLLVDVLATANGVWTGGSESKRGPLGPEPGFMHLYRRAADGTWSREYLSTFDLGFSCFLPTGGAPAVAGFDPSTTAGEIGKSRILVRGASGWEETQTVDNVNFTDALPLPGGKVLVSGHDNRAQQGVLFLYDGTRAEIASRTTSDAGQVFTFGVAQVSPSSYVIPGFGSDIGAVLYRWDGVADTMTQTNEIPVSAVFFSAAAASPTEIWLAGYEGRLLRFDGGSDIVAARTPGVTVESARHRSATGADLPDWYGLAPSARPLSDVMDVVAAVPSGGWAEFGFGWAPKQPVPASSLRLFTVEEQGNPRQLFLDTGASPAPEGAFELLEPSGHSLGGEMQLLPGSVYTVRFTVRDGGFTRYDLDPRPARLRESVLLTTP